MSGWEEWNEFVRKNNISKEKQIQLYKEIEDDLKRLEKQVKKEAREDHEFKRVFDLDPKKKAVAEKYLDRSAKVKAANELYDSYEYMKEERDAKPERTSLCDKYTGALRENCTIMFGGKRRVKKSIRKSRGKKSARKSRSKKSRSKKLKNRK